MDFLKKIYAQLSDLYRSLTPSARMTAGLLIAALVVGVALLFRTSVSGPDDYLMGGEPIATPSMRGTIEAAFHKKGLVSYQIDGARVRVPKGQQADYMGALVDGDALPPAFGKYFKAALEKSSFVTPKGQREDMMKFAREQELTRIIGKMSGIETADVIYNREFIGGLDQKQITTAMVHITPRGGEVLDDSRVQGIRAMVAAAIPGGTPENVTVVVDANSNSAFSAGSAGQLSTGAPDRYVATKLEYERTWTQKIRQALQGIPGAVVSVNVVLTTDLENVENRTVINPKVVPLEVRESTRSTVSQGTAAGGKPGTAGHESGPAPSTVGFNGPSRVEEETTDRQEKNLVSEQKLQSRKAGLTPQRVGVSISVPSNYVEQLWRQRNQARGADGKPEMPVAFATIETDLKATIQNLVTPIIGLAAGSDSNSTVSVTVVPNLPQAAITPPTPLELTTQWLLDNWTTLGLAALAIVALWMVRSLFRGDSASRKATAGADAGPRVSDRFEPTVGQASYPVRSDRKRGRPDSLSDQLVDVVRDDPEAAASVLRNWISSPS